MTETQTTPRVIWRTEPLRQWCEALWSGEYQQAKGHLAAVLPRPEDGPYEEPKVGYCCLGVGCLIAHIQYTLDGYDDIEDGDPAGRFGDQGYADLAPPEFLAWLGTPVADIGTSGGNGWDVILDIDPNQPTQGPRADYWTDDVAEHGRASQVTGAGLNDEGFTFAQIADLIWYFGLRDGVQDV